MLLLSQESCFSMEACAWQGVGHRVDVSGHRSAGNISAYVRGAIPASEYTHGIGVDSKQPVIIQHVSFRAISTCPVCLDRPHEEQANLAVEKISANAVVRSVEG